ncbi:MAG: type II toxin-antitoxin system RelE/ParE family toxin [Bacteroidetes bacterium]|nr:type II toxin-antitoxin system RelE/ParE family toxin [Bacteroidota bacterium]
MCYEHLIDNPLRYSFINQNYRRIRTSRFPYILIYEIEGDGIIINTVRHIKRKPL